MRKMRKAKRLAIMVHVVRAQGLVPIWTTRDSLPFHLADISQGQLIQMGGIPMLLQRNPTLRKLPAQQARLLSIRRHRQPPVTDKSVDAMNWRIPARVDNHGVLI